MQHPEGVSLNRVLAALSDPSRTELILGLADGAEHAWGDLSLPLAKSTLSYHIRLLREAGIVATRKEGNRCFVRLRDTDMNSNFPGLLDAILAAAAAECTR